MPNLEGHLKEEGRDSIDPSSKDRGGWEALRHSPLECDS